MPTSSSLTSGAATAYNYVVPLDYNSYHSGWYTAMSTTIEATYDGNVFRPTGPVSLSPNTPVRLTVETLPPPTRPPTSFLQTTRALHLQGPPDWASNLDDYLYGKEADGGR
jgi:hypothetical protein